MKNRINRREFVKGIGAGAVAAIGLPYVISSKVLANPPSGRITLGFIGMGKQGRGLLWSFLQQPGCRVVAVCDVDEQKLGRAKAMVDDCYAMLGECAGYRDFREVLARRDIDAVVIATPDHWHSVISIEACKAGKDVYCEKPLAVTVTEARKIVNAARHYGRVFQTGSMQRSDLKFRQACEIVRNGFIGRVKTVRLFLGTTLGSSAFPIYPVACDLAGEPTPEYLDWDMWLGPAPWRRFNSRIASSIEDLGWAHWRDYEDYAGGLMTDWGAHHFDIAQWGLGMDESGPVEIYPEGIAGYRKLTYKYANGVTVSRDDTMQSRSIEFGGSDGVVEVSRDFISARPQSLLRKRIGPGGIHLYESQNHYVNWLDCIGNRQKPICDAEIGCRSATVCHLGIIAHRLGRPLKWDPAAERFINDPEADRLLSRPMRSPWIV